MGARPMKNSVYVSPDPGQVASTGIPVRRSTSWVTTPPGRLHATGIRRPA